MRKNSMRRIIIKMIFLFVTNLVLVAAKSKIRRKRAWIIDSFAIEEEHPGPFPYLLGTISVERTYLIHFHLRGRGIDEDPKDVLSINSRNGHVYVHKKVDYESHRNLTFKFEARDGQHALDTRLGVEIKILDINDHAPIFEPSIYTITLEESVPQGTLVTLVFATDDDDSTTKNGTFTFKVTSVTPKTDNIEFYIHKHNSTTGKVYFKGCLDYEKAQKYTVLIEAKDEGEKVQLSSTGTVIINIIDKNNHLPEIINQKGPGRIKERVSGLEVLRLNVSDKDTQGSPAWKAKFTLDGDPEHYFKIQTDLITNEGIITVIKAMDYEEQTSRNVSITVENEVPYFFCKVKSRTSWGLWEVETFPKKTSTSVPFLLKPYPVTITVEDVNDPPEFVPPVKHITIMENTKIGTHLDTLKVIDPDKTFGNTFHFVKGDDKNNWVTVDSETGQVSVAKLMDRESLVNDSTYSVIVHAVNKAQPPQTGTGTLVIHLKDENDNVPQLEVDTINICLSDEKTMTKISAKDPDLVPYSAPFKYELLEDEDMEGQWKIEPNHGISANLVKESTVTAGHYKIKIKISDNQDIGSVQNLSITVCDCTSNANCQAGLFTAQPSLSVIGIVIFAVLLFLVMLLMTLLPHKKQMKLIMLPDDVSGNLIKSNTEMIGTDCEITLALMNQSSMMMSNGCSTQHQTDFQGSSQTSIENRRFGKSIRMSTRRCSFGQIQNDVTQQISKNVTICYSDDYSIMKILSNRLDQILLKLQTQEPEFCDYKPHCYTDETTPDQSSDEKLDAISIPETDFQLDILTNLDLHFSNLAAVCMPDVSSDSFKN